LLSFKLTKAKVWTAKCILVIIASYRLSVTAVGVSDKRASDASPALQLYLAAGRSDCSECVTIFQGIVGTLDKSLEGCTPADRSVSVADASGWGLRRMAVSVFAEITSGMQ